MVIPKSAKSPVGIPSASSSIMTNQTYVPGDNTPATGIVKSVASNVGTAPTTAALTAGVNPCCGSSHNTPAGVLTPM